MSASTSNHAATSTRRHGCGGEDQARYLVAVPAGEAEFIYTCADEAGVPAEPVGVVGGCEIAYGDDAIDLADLRAAWEGWMPNYMAKAG